jgi:hypothetical protein
MSKMHEDHIPLAELRRNFIAAAAMLLVVMGGAFVVVQLFEMFHWN